jgi:Gram-negative bacterial TonB protein C-terminal
MKRLWLFAVLAVSAVAADDANVKAFISTLTPLKHVEAVYPDAAKQQNAYGRVLLFVTIDAGGNVVAADAAEGPAVLRQAAIDSVKQWTFRPVVRDGHAVSAITTAGVDVMPPLAPGERRPPTKMEFNAQDAIAYAQRLSELTKQFPRTPEQVLADDEQQSLGDSGHNRFYDLAKLAKAAFAAGDLIKAKALATELLGDAPQYKGDWNYGNAIHDGNMVMGLVALRGGSTATAVQYLQAAGKSPGSPQLGSFGPNMTLAKELIDAGQGAAVVGYFDECRTFWKMGGQKLDDWSAMVRGGGKPNFGANLLY